jgi:hypothetical protein
MIVREKEKTTTKALGIFSLLIPSILIIFTVLFSLQTPVGAPVNFLMMRILAFA